MNLINPFGQIVKESGGEKCAAVGIAVVFVDFRSVARNPVGFRADRHKFIVVSAESQIVEKGAGFVPAGKKNHQFLDENTDGNLDPYFSGGSGKD